MNEIFLNQVADFVIIELFNLAKHEAKHSRLCYFGVSGDWPEELTKRIRTKLKNVNNSVRDIQVAILDPEKSDSAPPNDLHIKFSRAVEIRNGEITPESEIPRVLCMLVDERSTKLLPDFLTKKESLQVSLKIEISWQSLCDNVCSISKDVGTDISEIIQHSGVKDDFKKFVYASSVASSPDPNRLGIELNFLDLIPTLGLTDKSLIIRNRKAVREISHPSTPSVSVAQYLLNGGLEDDRSEGDSIFSKLVAILNLKNVEATKPSSWIEVIRHRPNFETLTFDKWKFVSVGGELEAIEFESFIDSGGVVKKKTKLTQKQPNSIPMMDPSKGVTFNWNTRPLVSQDPVVFEVSIEPVNPEALDRIGECGQKFFALEKRRGNIKPSWETFDEETKDAIKEEKFRLHIVVTKDKKLLTNGSGLIVEGYSEEFFISKTPSDPDGERFDLSYKQSQISLPIAILALVYKGLIVGTPSIVGGKFHKKTPSGISYLFNSENNVKAENKNIQEEVTIRCAKVVFHAVEKLVKERDRFTTLSANLSVENEFHPDLLIPLSVGVLDDELLSLRRCALDALEVDDEVFLPEWLVNERWMEFQEKVNLYCAEYINRIRSAESPEARNQLLSIDTLKASFLINNESVSVVVLLPTHPLRLAWYSNYFREVSGFTEKLLLSNQQNFKQIFDLDGASKILPGPNPLVFSSAGQDFIFASNYGLSSAIYVEIEKLNEPLLLASLLNYFEADSINFDSEVDSNELAEKIRRYRVSHPHIHRIEIAANSESLSNAMLSATSAFIKKKIESETKGGAETDSDSESDSSFDGFRKVEELRLGLSVRRDGAYSTAPFESLVDLQAKHQDGDIRRGTDLDPGIRVAEWQENKTVLPAFNIVLRREKANLEVVNNNFDFVLPSVVSGLVSYVLSTFQVDDLNVPRWLNRGSLVVGLSDDKERQIYSELSLLMQTPFSGNENTDSRAVNAYIPDDELQLLSELHNDSDWVVSSVRFTGAEYFDSPLIEETVREKHRYVLDYVPDVGLTSKNRLVVSTMYSREVELAFGRALKDLKVGHVEIQANVLLRDLKRVSGRLITRLLSSVGTSDISTLGEAAGLAVLSRYLFCGEISTRPVAFMVPLDDHPDFFGSKFVRESEGQGKRCDLLQVSLVAGIIQFHVVEVKFRGSRYQVNDDLKYYIARQTKNTRDFLENRFWSVARIDAEIQRGKMLKLLLSYLERASRHGLIPENKKIDFISALIKLCTGLDQVDLGERGYIVCLELPNSPEPEYYDNCEIYILSEAETSAVGIESEFSVSSRSMSAEDLVPFKKDSEVKTPIIPSVVAVPQVRSSEDVASEKIGEATPRSGVIESVVIPISGSKILGGTKAVEPRSLDKVVVALGRATEDNKFVEWHLSTRTAPHCLVVGRSGSGKSTTVIKIVHEFYTQGLPCIIFDYHGEYHKRLGLEIPVFDALEGLPISPFRISLKRDASPERLSRELKLRISEIVELLTSTVKLGVRQKENLRRAIEKAFKNIDFVSNPDSFPSVESVFKCIQAEEHGVTAGEGVVDRLRDLLDLGVVLDATDDKLSVLYGGAFIDLSGLSSRPELQQLIVAFLLRRIHQDCQRWDNKGNLALAVVLDEAHKHVGEVSHAGLMREGRKFGVVVINASQSVQDFGDETLQNVGATIIFRQNPGESQRAAGMLSSAKGTNYARDFEALSTGFAFVQTTEITRAKKVRMSPSNLDINVQG